MIKAIPTKYSGVEFRSRLEARWAVYFDAIGIKWEYEFQGYALPSGWYLPDFWLPQYELWAEVKPCDLSDAEKQKVHELVEGTRNGCLMLVGSPRACSYTAFMHGSHDVDRFPDCVYWADVIVHADHRCNEVIYQDTGIIPEDESDFELLKNHRNSNNRKLFARVFEAASAARSAKFK